MTGHRASDCVDVFAPAKINLTLHVTGQRDDGYHLLDSLVVFARDVGDRLRIAPSEELTLSLSGEFVDGVPTDSSNLVLKAADLLQSRRGVTRGANIILEKSLPNGAGIGGGSSDAAAALKALARLWQVMPLSVAEASPLGADVPVCMTGPKPQHMQGIGEVLSAVPTLPDMHLVLANCGDQISTKAVFQCLREEYGTGRPPMEALPDDWDFEDFQVWLLGHGNDLTRYASEFSDNIQCMLSALRDTGAADTDMSGSGSTCWGLFRAASDAENAVKAISAQYPEWWVRHTAVST